MSTNGERNIEKGNQEYAASFSQGHLALPPSEKYAVCTCKTHFGVKQWLTCPL
jgi:carbonic anhydrase